MVVLKTTLSHQIEIAGKPVIVVLSDAARNALSRRTSPLVAEMELYFSCLIRKQVRFHEKSSANGIPVAALNERLHIHFRPVMTQRCGKDYEGDEPPLTDFPIVNKRAYIPHWLHIDFRGGQWQGEFGYDTRH